MEIKSKRFEYKLKILTILNIGDSYTNGIVNFFSNLRENYDFIKKCIVELRDSGYIKFNKKINKYSITRKGRKKLNESRC